MTDISVDALVDALTDNGLREWQDEVLTDDPLHFVDTQSYAERLRSARQHNPHAEAVRAGFATIGGHMCALTLCDFDFMAGTLGIAAAERIARTIVFATSRRLPVIGVCRSGGIRMQEGTPAFVRMMSLSAAIAEHREAGIPFITYLMDPSTGGALASWGSQGHLVLGQPGGLISLTGPRVAEIVGGGKVDPASLTSEAALAHGLIDGVVSPSELRVTVTSLLDLLGSPRVLSRRIRKAPAYDPLAVERTGVWDSIARSRADDRFGTEDLLDVNGEPFVELRGDRLGHDENGLITGFTQIAGHPVMLIGFRRRPSGRGASVGTAGYRKALRAMRVAEELRLPLVTVVDTAGAPTGVDAELSGLAPAIGDCLTMLLTLRVPTMSVILGEGSGGGAIALLPADAIIGLEHSWVAPIAPEAGSTILFRSPEKAQLVAESQRVGVFAMKQDELVDEIVPEDSDVPVETTLQRAIDAVALHLWRLEAEHAADRLARRRARIRSFSRQMLAIHPDD
ncbi:MAG: carboxyl transferase domain-containing protein [Acidimicrobiia bacterium]